MLRKDLVRTVEPTTERTVIPVQVCIRAASASPTSGQNVLTSADRSSEMG
ncbi:hypothetical protein GZL_00199 [Streptomyces sp. 769]|nr:hypothetical protein GZL_00199 [Streptomyces sp. 769]